MEKAMQQKVFYVVFVTTKYVSFAEAKEKAPEMIAQHITRSKQLHEQGKLLMSGAFLDRPDEPLSTMGVLTSKEDVEDYINNDPFVKNNMVTHWYMREWANMFAK